MGGHGTFNIAQNMSRENESQKRSQHIQSVDLELLILLTMLQYFSW